MPYFLYGASNLGSWRGADLALVAPAPLWTDAPPLAAVQPWTDDFSNIPGVMRWR